MKKLLYFCGLGLMFILGFVVSECTHEPCPEIKESKEVHTKRTIIRPDSNKVTKKDFKPTPKRLWPNLLKPGRTHTVDYDSIEKDTTARFVYNDSTITNEVSIWVTDTTTGLILSKQIRYKLKVPLMIIDSVFTTITKEVEKPVAQRGLFIGGEIGVNFQGGSRVAPEIEYLDKKGYAYSYNYDVLNNYHSVGVKKKLKL